MTTEVLILSLLFLFAINTPIAIAIGVASVTAILIQGDFNLMMVVQRMFGGTDSFHLMAVPLFMFTGTIMEAGGISRRIIDFANALVGWLPGGLAAVTIVSAMFFAGISGSAAADAAAVGAILIPAMKKSGYDSDFAAAVQASGGSIGVIIPPSIPMIIFGFLTGASIGQLFAAGIIPGILIGLSLIMVSSLISMKHGYSAAIPFSLAETWRTFRRALLAMGAPIIILGGILTGVFTATESAAVAVVYALLVGMFVYRKIAIQDLFHLFRDGAVTSGIVMFIIAMASIFSWIAAIEDIPAQLAGGLLSLTENPIILLLTKIPVCGANDTLRNRRLSHVKQSKRIAQCNCPFADDKIIRVAKFDKREFSSPVNFEQGNIGDIIGRNQRGIIFFTIRQRDHDFNSFMNHMFISYDITIR